MKARLYQSVVRFILSTVLVTTVATCSLSAYQNRPLSTETPPPSIATLDVDHRHQGKQGRSRFVSFVRRWEQSSLLLRIYDASAPEGISRCRYLSKVDAISSVSGGSLTAAYYTLSQDPSDPARAADKSKPLWEPRTVKDVMSLNYTARWFTEGFALRIWNWPRSWLTSYNRTDALAETFNCESPLCWSLVSFPLAYHVQRSQSSPTMLDYQCDQWHIGLRRSSAVWSAVYVTQEDFRDELGADINEYPLGFAVAASAAFPGVFNYLTLRNYDEDSRYTHLFDGGSYDNLGLSVFKPIILQNAKRYKQIIVISIDASGAGVGVDGEAYDVRHWTDRFVDSDFMSSFDIFLSARRTQILRQFVSGQLVDDKSDNEIGYDKVPTVRVENLTFWHVTFDAVPSSKRILKRDLRKIPTAFSISSDDTET